MCSYTSGFALDQVWLGRSGLWISVIGGDDTLVISDPLGHL